FRSMRGKRALLPLVFILFLLLPATNIDWITYSERLEPSAGDLLADITEGEINQSNDGEYRDGIIDNFDQFINPGYPSGHIQNDGNMGSG
ncbi:MAG: hypothetical protein QG610_380, partial [Euryarchaeota archaeon]|nr:hypothetical protein [Euryarchaeota archaeon]